MLFMFEAALNVICWLGIFVANPVKFGVMYSHFSFVHPLNRDQDVFFLETTFNYPRPYRVWKLKGRV